MSAPRDPYADEWEALVQDARRASFGAKRWARVATHRLHRDEVWRRARRVARWQRWHRLTRWARR